jgi:hypothetical protein
MSTKTTQLQSTVTFETITCGACGIAFWVPDWFYRDRLKTHEEWYCPNGHSRVFLGETEEQRLKKKLEQAQKDMAWWREGYAERSAAVVAERKAHAATKGKLTKTRNRLAAGVCPYCHRNFVALGRHIRGQHPEEAKHD